MFSNIASRRFFAKPVEERAANRPARMPKSRENMAMQSIADPYFRTFCMFPAVMPLSIRDAMIYGMRSSITTSAPVKPGVRIEGSLYSPTFERSVFSMWDLLAPGPADLAACRRR